MCKKITVVCQVVSIRYKRDWNIVLLVVIPFLEFNLRIVRLGLVGFTEHIFRGNLTFATACMYISRYVRKNQLLRSTGYTCKKFYERLLMLGKKIILIPLKDYM